MSSLFQIVSSLHREQAHSAPNAFLTLSFASISAIKFQPKAKTQFG